MVVEIVMYVWYAMTKGTLPLITQLHEIARQYRYANDSAADGFAIRIFITLVI